MTTMNEELDTRTQTTRLDDEPELLKSAHLHIQCMNETAEKLERARSAKSQANLAEELEVFKNWFRDKEIIWEEDHNRFTLVPTEKQLQTQAEMIRQWNVEYEKRQIAHMYEEIETYLERTRRLLVDALPDIRKYKLGRLSGSNDLKYYGDKIAELVTRIEASEKMIKAYTLPELK